MLQSNSISELVSDIGTQVAAKVVYV